MARIITVLFFGLWLRAGLAGTAPALDAKASPVRPEPGLAFVLLDTRTPGAKPALYVLMKGRLKDLSAAASTVRLARWYPLNPGAALSAERVSAAVSYQRGRLKEAALEKFEAILKNYPQVYELSGDASTTRKVGFTPRYFPYLLTAKDFERKWSFVSPLSVPEGRPGPVPVDGAFSFLPSFAFPGAYAKPGPTLLFFTKDNAQLGRTLMFFSGDGEPLKFEGAVSNGASEPGLKAEAQNVFGAAKVAYLKSIAASPQILKYEIVSPLLVRELQQATLLWPAGLEGENGQVSQFRQFEIALPKELGAED